MTIALIVGAIVAVVSGAVALLSAGLAWFAWKRLRSTHP